LVPTTHSDRQGGVLSWNVCAHCGAYSAVEKAAGVLDRSRLGVVNSMEHEALASSSSVGVSHVDVRARRSRCRRQSCSTCGRAGPRPRQWPEPRAAESVGWRAAAVRVAETGPEIREFRARGGAPQNRERGARRVASAGALCFSATNGRLPRRGGAWSAVRVRCDAGCHCAGSRVCGAAAWESVTGRSRAYLSARGCGCAARYANHRRCGRGRQFDSGAYVCRSGRLPIATSRDRG
jgi:hypothetical protein